MTPNDQFNAAWASREWGLWGIDDEACARYWFEKGYRGALERACAALRELRESHARDAGEPLGDPSCDFQAAWETAEENITALLGKEGQP